MSSLRPSELAVEYDARRRLADLDRRLLHQHARLGRPANLRPAFGVVRWGPTAAGTVDLSEARLTTSDGSSGTQPLVWIDAANSPPPTGFGMVVGLLPTGRMATRAGTTRPVYRVMPTTCRPRKESGYESGGLWAEAQVVSIDTSITGKTLVRVKPTEPVTYSGTGWQDTASYLDLFVARGSAESYPVYQAGDRLRVPLGLTAWCLDYNGRQFLRPDWELRPRRSLGHTWAPTASYLLTPADLGELVEFRIGGMIHLFTNGVVARWNKLAVNATSGSGVATINFGAQTYTTQAVVTAVSVSETTGSVVLATTGNAVISALSLTLLRDSYRRTIGLSGTTLGVQTIVGGSMDVG